MERRMNLLYVVLPILISDFIVTDSLQKHTISLIVFRDVREASTDVPDENAVYNSNVNRLRSSRNLSKKPLGHGAPQFDHSFGISSQ